MSVDATTHGTHEATAPAGSPPLLRAESISMVFGGVVALQDVALDAHLGEITALIGPNGAGKTTMLNVISGTLKPTRGKVLLKGEDVTKLPPFRRAGRGVARTFQKIEVFSRLSVYENLLVAWEAAGSWRVLGRDRRQGREDVERILAELQLESVAKQAAGQLPTGLARLVELGRALCTKPSLLLLDEPCSGLGPEETTVFTSALQRVVTENAATLGVVMVEHHMEVVLGVSHQITVLDFGRLLARGTPAEIRSNPLVIEAYLGGEAAGDDE
jgi:branched-chain amino acid transport system ATP-binding protein